MNYGSLVARRRNTAQNNAGGATFTTDKWTRLSRFLILGSEGGSYYVSARKLTRENATAVEACWLEDPDRTVKLITEISDGGRAPKNDPAIFALALGAASTGRARSLALAHLAIVCRIPTHLFHFLEYVKHLRGWGRGLRSAIAEWYNMRDVDALSQQIVKYPSRDGWSHKDALILAHPTPRTPEHSLLFKYVIQSFENLDHAERAKLPGVVRAVEAIKNEQNIDTIVGVIREYFLTREMIPTFALNSPEVWHALLETMPITAMLRNLGNMSKVGLLTQGSDASTLVVSKLTDGDILKRGRVHPLSILVAQRVYATGKGLKGSGEWPAVPAVIDALDDAFYASFDHLEPSNKRYLLALDVSGSMGWGNIAGLPLTPREACACLAMVTIRAERETHIVGFTEVLRPLSISKRQRLDDVVRYLNNLPYGATDCSLPAQYAKAHGLNLDAICIYTDNETWVGHQPVTTLKAYRDARAPECRQIVVGMTATDFTIADPADPLSLDVVGFDTATPAVIAQFVG